jgi:predicted metal-binding membrane protein
MVTMLIAAVLHTIAMFAIMMPAFVVISLENFPLAISTATNFLEKLGLIAGIFDVWIVASLRLHSLLQYCAHKRMLMLPTLDMGSTALVVF